MRSRVITIAKALGFESRNLAGAVSLVRWQLSVLTHGPHLNPLPEGEEDAQRQVRVTSANFAGAAARQKPRAQSRVRFENALLPPGIARSVRLFPPVFLLFLLRRAIFPARGANRALFLSGLAN